MNTYPTYQAAKIANPDSEIYKLGGRFTTNSSSELGVLLPPCHLADYCMTVKQFLEDGHKFVAGDKYINEGDVFAIPSDGLSSSNSHIDGDNKCYVLKAKALEETSPEEKEALDEKTYRYEKVNFDIASRAVAAWEDGELFTNVSHDTYAKIETALDVLTYLHRLHRRIEVTERDLEIEAARELYNTYMAVWDDPLQPWSVLDDKNKEAFISIVRKTGYRKSLNDVNGKG